jgi:hypothetical protein
VRRAQLGEFLRWKAVVDHADDGTAASAG